MGGTASEATAADGVAVGATARVRREPAGREDWRDAAEPLNAIITSYIHHPGLGTLFLGVFLVLKGYVLAKGDIPLALGILQNAGLPTVVIGGLLSGLPILVAALLAGTMFNALTRGGEAKKSVKGLPLSPLAVVALATILLSLIFTQWPFMVFAAGIGLVIGVINRMNLPWFTVAAYLVALVLAVYAVTVMLYTVWLPREKLIIAGVNQPAVGYVLADNPDGWITILLSQQHGIVTYRDSDVAFRQTCEQAPGTIWSQLTDAATPWQEITKWSLLTFLHPAPEPPC
jgi:hypothetical protein